jgi:phenylalanyl-tRNA synthetase beta chain
MLVPVDWLREYTSFDITPEELAERLTLAGLEVEEILEKDGKIVFSTYVTPNRSDLLSIVGVAREVSALLGTKFELPHPSITEGEIPIETLAKIDIESPQNCPRYSARVILDTKVVDSPQWMQERLTAAGMRPINNVVDATNYVLLELGQPLHAFDYDLVADHHIIVRQAFPGEKITTLDGEERGLDPSMLVIADSKRAVAVGGVMGGLDTEVTSNTRNVLLESAHFNRLSIRRTARTLQLTTEASYRFERWVDPNGTISALDRVAELIVATGGGTIAKGVLDVYPIKTEPVEVSIRPSRASMLLGLDVSPTLVSDYLTRLGMEVDASDQTNIRCTVPTFRPDIKREEDLIEEIGRLYGYDRIPATLPVGVTLQGRDSDEGAFAAKVTEILVSMGLEEVVTGSMSPPQGDERQVFIKNPISEDLSTLRKHLLLDLLGVVSYNLNRGFRDIGIFEIGRVFAPKEDGNLLIESLSIAAVLTGSMWGEAWNIDRSSLEADFFLCKGMVETLLSRLGVQDTLYEPLESRWFHPTRAAVVKAGDVKLGVVGQINPDLAEKYDIPAQTYGFELDFNALMDKAAGLKSYKPLSRYPAVTRDLAVVVAEDVPYQRVKELLAKEGGELLESLTLFDVYSGPPLPTGRKSLAFSIVFRSYERTLRDEEIDEKLNRMRNLLAVEVGATFRDT